MSGIWVLEFTHPCSMRREFWVFDNYQEAREKLTRWEVFDPHLWEL